VSERVNDTKESCLSDVIVCGSGDNSGTRGATVH
jgi:hypothetical protein